MTPFDPTSLLIVLLTFYPTVSASELARARLERPEVFSGGTLGGSHGDKLTLPDGRIFDLIFAVDGGGVPRWQVIEVTDSTIDEWMARYPLEAGPLAPIDEQEWPAPSPRTVFEPLVSARLAELGGAGGVLDTALSELSANGTPVGLQTAYDQTVVPAAGATNEISAGILNDRPADVVNNTNNASGGIDGLQAPYSEQVPAEIPPGDPGQPPPGVQGPEGDPPSPWF